MPIQTDATPTGFLVIRKHGDRAFYEGKWRDSTRTQRKRRLGRAWLEQRAGEWVKPSGRVRNGFLDERRAHVKLAQIIADQEAALRRADNQRDASFAAVAAGWLEFVEHEKRVKPSTLADYRIMLAKGNGKKGQRGARIMRTFGGRDLVDIDTVAVQRFLALLDREKITARTVNKHRQLLHAIFAYAMRSDTYGLRTNPVSDTKKRPEAGAAPIDTFETNEVRAIAKAAREGLHRNRRKYDRLPSANAEWKRTNTQDAALFIIAAFTGLRLGELLALRWKDVDLEDSRLTVERAVSAGREVATTKSRNFRTVPLSEQAAAELHQLAKRERFTGRSDSVFCRATGEALDGFTVRRRFLAAQEAAGVRVRRFHDLRHSFGSLAVRSFDPVSVQSMMGHANLATTERYLHSKPRDDDATKLTAAFS